MASHPSNGVSVTRAKMVSGASPTCIGGASSPMIASITDCVLSASIGMYSSAASATSATIGVFECLVVLVGGAVVFGAPLRVGTSVQPSLSGAGAAVAPLFFCVPNVMTRGFGAAGC